MADIPSLSRIKPTTRTPRPLPQFPPLASFVQGKVVTKQDMQQIDRALSSWLSQLQTAIDSSYATK